MENIQKPEPLETVELTQPEIKILFAILTKEKFVLQDSQFILPIAIKLQVKIKPDETPKVDKVEPVKKN